MIKKEDVYKIGVLTKPHGIKGEVSFSFTDDVFDRVECDYLICLMDGILVPFFIEEYRFKNDSVALVKFDGIDTAGTAFHECRSLLPAPSGSRGDGRRIVMGLFCGLRGV